MKINQPIDHESNPTKNGSNHQKPMIGTIFKLFLASYVPASLYFILID
ncbi:hypothetical protein ACFQ3N_19720 [Virgibacillus byunsanensis]|uniref:Uncharacterized protein n=1 Tax=Virgibacillus byunsanensis TaxID=570945 RepID=A0ABW3LQE4_9BACI